MAISLKTCDDCDAWGTVSSEVDAHDPTLLHNTCRDCGAAWDDYDD